jgi:hypothetical protein
VDHDLGERWIRRRPPPKNSTAATHRIPDGKKTCHDGGHRSFNDDYLALMRHFSMTPRTTGIGEKEQNGDVEARNGALKRALEQALLLRSSRDFESVAASSALARSDPPVLAKRDPPRPRLRFQISKPSARP